MDDCMWRVRWLGICYKQGDLCSQYAAYLSTSSRVSKASYWPVSAANPPVMLLHTKCCAAHRSARCGQPTKRQYTHSTPWLVSTVDQRWMMYTVAADT